MDDNSRVNHFIKHSDNTCEINLMDIAEKSEVKADQIEKGDTKELDTLSAKYVNKARRNVSKTFLKRALL
jgi:hypothetical protein